MNETDYTVRRVWTKTHILFLKRLAQINKTRPIQKPLSFIEFIDEVAHGRIIMPAAGQKPLRVSGTIG